MQRSACRSPCLQRATWRGDKLTNHFSRLLVMRSWECPSVSYCEMEITNGTYFIISRGLSELLRFFAEVASLVCITVPDMWVALDEHLLNE